MKNVSLLIIALILFSACGKEPDITDNMLDGDFIFDQSLYQPEKYLLSVAKPNPTTLEKQRPVVIAIHGYGASTFEWDEYRTWAGTRTDFFISQVLLGGHGRDYQSFKNSSWKDWQTPIKTEFEALEQKGYTNISFAGSSTGCTLLLQLIADGYFDTHIKPKNFFLVDPIIVPGNKSLTLVGTLGPIIGYTTVENTAGEEKYYYHYRPYETLQELRDVINVVRNNLEKGFTLPTSSSLKIYKSDKDDVADAVSAVLIYKGLKTSNGNPINVDLIDSKLHVYTRLSGREPAASSQDVQKQTNTFADMTSLILR